MQKRNKRQEEIKRHFDNSYKAQQLMLRADRMAKDKMLEDGYQDPRLSALKGGVEDFDKCKEYEQRLAFYRHVALKELENQVTVNVPRPFNDWVNSSYDR